MSVKSRKLVNVIMATFKEDIHYVQQAVESILNQTYENLKLIIVNDNPADEVIHNYIISLKDSRIQYLRNKKNSGLAASLNKAIKLSNSEYIFRMDADDISEKDRFEKQVAFLDQHKEISILGSWVYTIDENNIRTGVSTCPGNHERIKANTVLGSPMFHSTVAFRREVFDVYELYYNESFKYTQDYELWSRAVHIVKFANLCEPLLSWRKSKEMVSFKNNKEQDTFVKTIHLKQLERIGILPTRNQKQMHSNLYNDSFPLFQDIFQSFLWIHKLLYINRAKKVFSGFELGKVLSYHFRIGVQRSPWKLLGLPVWVTLKIYSLFYK